MPKSVGDAVSAGTLNVGGGALEVRTTAAAGDSAVARMAALVEKVRPGTFAALIHPFWVGVFKFKGILWLALVEKVRHDTFLGFVFNIWGKEGEGV